jgi:methionyl-tRNA formyltransferase
MGGPDLAQGLRLVLLGDGEWAVRTLDRLAAAPPHRLVGVVARSVPTSGALVARSADLGVPCVQPADVNAPELVAQLGAWRADLGISVAYNQILRTRARQAFRHGCLNVHAGMLPEYRGRNVVNWALINGATEIGITVHFIDDGIDTGDIVLQDVVPVGWTDTYGDVLSRVVDRVPELVDEAVQRMAGGRLERRSQADLAGTYVGARRPGDEWLDWSDSSRNLHNKVRAITRPGPGARSAIGDTPVTVWRAHWDPGWPCYVATPGEIVGRAPGVGVLVKTGDSTLLLQEVETSGCAPGVPTWRIGTRLDGRHAFELAALQSEVAELKARLAALEGALGPPSERSLAVTVARGH